jgi:hypothetical protein
MNQPLPNTQGQPLQPDYEKAELDLLRAALKRTHAQRFEMLTRLMKIQFTLNKAKIIHKPYTLKK